VVTDQATTRRNLKFGETTVRPSFTIHIMYHPTRGGVRGGQDQVSTTTYASSLVRMSIKYYLFSSLGRL
jgi:hypothetical protein